MKKYLLPTLLLAATAFSPLGVLQADDDDDHRCKDCGVVTAIEAVETSGGSGLGAAAGAVAGGLLGNQVGKTETAASTVGGTAATILGVAGGALSGHYAEKAVRGGKAWTVAVRMDSGDTQTLTMQSEPKVQAGDRVRVTKDGVVPYKGAGKKSESDDDDHDNEDND